jgi:preprotein translocase subunit YajC
VTWQGLVDIVRDVLIPFLVLFVLPLFLWYQRDRRKNRAESVVAERTVGVDVTVKETGGLGASVAFVQEAFRVERESKDREIDRLTRKVEALELSEAEKDRRIAALEQVDEEKDRVIHELRRQIRQLEARLDVLEHRAPGEPPTPHGEGS